MTFSQGKQFRFLVQSNPPLQILGTINAYSAMLAKSVGAKALYLSGAGVANASYGLPDLGMTNLSDVLEDARRITQACNLPLLVDIDTGWGHAFNIARAIKLLEQANVAAIHIEDQITAKRCGHRPNKGIVTSEEMVDRIKAAVDARTDDHFVIIARTDAFANEGLNAAIDRAQLYVEHGADMVFPEALTSLNDYQAFTKHLNVPILSNMTEFGQTPLFTRDELSQVGIQLILYPLSAFRAMSQAALNVYGAIIEQGSQKEQINSMQSRAELYKVLNYHHYEQTLNKIYGEQHGQ